MGRPEIYPKANFSSSSPPLLQYRRKATCNSRDFFWGGRGDSFPLFHDLRSTWRMCGKTRDAAFLFFPPLPPPILGAGNFSAIVKMWGTPYPTKTMEGLGGRDWGCDGEAMRRQRRGGEGGNIFLFFF